MTLADISQRRNDVRFTSKSRHRTSHDRQVDFQNCCGSDPKFFGHSRSPPVHSRVFRASTDALKSLHRIDIGAAIADVDRRQKGRSERAKNQP